MGELVMMPALADGVASSLDWATVSGAFSNAFSMVTQCTNFIVENSIFLTVFALGLIPIGFKIIKKAKRAVK